MSGQPEQIITKIIVSVLLSGGQEAFDLELAAELPASTLGPLLAQALAKHMGPGPAPQSYQIEAHPPGRLLAPEESLAQAGAWDGAWLILHHDRAHAPGPAPVRRQTGPVLGWRSINPNEAGGAGRS